MAMAVSAQGSPFKPCCASSFWLSPSHFRRRSSTSSSSSYAFSKGFDRREIHSLQSGDGRRSHSCDSPYFPKIKVLAIWRNSSAGFDRTSLYSPPKFSYKDKVLTVTYDNWQSVEEEKKQNLRPCVDEPSEKGVDAITPCRHSACRSVFKARQSDNLKSKRTWFEEGQKMKAARLKQQGPHNLSGIPQGGNILRNEKVECIQDGSDKLTSGPCLIANGHASAVTLSSNELGVRGNSFGVGVYNASKEYTPPNLSGKADLSLPQSARRAVQYNGSLTKSLPVKYKDNLSELMDVCPDPAIERTTLDHKFSITDRSVESTSEQKHFEKECGTRNLPFEHKENLSASGEVCPDNAIGRGTCDGKSPITDVNTTTVQKKSKEECSIRVSEQHEELTHIYDNVLVVDSISMAKNVVKMLTQKYKGLVHACDTEVAKIDVKQETPVGHGEIICFSIYSGPQADFGNGKSCVWVDVLDGGRHLLMEFAPFFEDPCIKKVWHNYSFDSHVIENYGFKVSGFHADTMHLARLWDSSRRIDGGYSLEALTGDPKVMSGAPKKKQEATSGAPKKKQEATSGAHSSTEWELISGKISLKTIFGKKKIKKDGSEGKLINVAPVEELQRGERIPWICYSALDSISTLRLYNSLKAKLMTMNWVLGGFRRGTMYDFYEEYWRPFGELLVEMESEGMLVDRAYLSGIEKVATIQQQVAAGRFRNWASKYCPDAIYMNVGSDAQLRQLFFGGVMNRKDENESLPTERTFKVPNVDKVIEEGKKAPSKYRNITLHKLVDGMQAEFFTATGWPSVSVDALKTLAGKVSAEEYGSVDDSYEGMVDEVEEGRRSAPTVSDIDTSAYGTAYAAFGEGKKGMEACHAIAALCEVCSIDSLISNFILPLQGCHISGTNGRIHCSLNINTETGRLSARRPNLQNQPALEKDRYKIRQAFIAEPGNSLIVADYGQLELRILAHLANCKSMLDAFKAGGDFHSRTAMNMYPHVREAVEEKRVLLEWYPQPGEEKPPVPLLKDAFASERRKAKMLNFSIAYGKTPVGLARDWKVSVRDAKKTVDLWYKERQEVLLWQEQRKAEAQKKQCVYTLLGRARLFPSMASASASQRGHIERAAINTPVQGSAADVAMCAMLEICRNAHLKQLGWRLLLQVHDEVILEGPSESAEIAKAIVVECMSKPFYGTNFLKVDLSVDAKCAKNWYDAK